MYKNGFILFDCIFYKIINGFSRGVLDVKDYLILQIKPLESEIYHTSTFPVIGYLFAGTVYYVRHFVGYDEFLVLLNRKISIKRIDNLPMRQNCHR